MLTPNVTLSGKTVLITGAAGFIGAHLAQTLIQTEPAVRVVGLDNKNDYYDVSLKEYRLQKIAALAAAPSTGEWTFVEGDIADEALLDSVFATYEPTVVVNLAAQAGVRYSIAHPEAYVHSNLCGFFRVLEACRRYPVAHLVYASSSSVYGENQTVPYRTEDKTDEPVSFYAATKKSNEMMAHAYAKLYDIPTTGLRFFTVYGPAGRPDMAYFHFADALRRGETITLFHHGNCRRDFTFIDDVVEGIGRVMRCAPERKQGPDGLPIAPCRLYNIGNSHPETLRDFVDTLQQELVVAGVLPETYDFEAHRRLVPMQPGDVVETYADVTPLERDFGVQPHTALREGLRAFVRWYKEFYRL